VISSYCEFIIFRVVLVFVDFVCMFNSNVKYIHHMLRLCTMVHYKIHELKCPGKMTILRKPQNVMPTKINEAKIRWYWIRETKT